MFEMILGAVLLVAGIVLGLGGGYSLAKRKRPPQPMALPPELERFAGRLIDERWPKEVIDEIKKDYFPLPPAKQQFLIRADLTGTCPLGHATTERVGILAATAALAQKFSSVLHKGRVEINCRECGKPAKVGARSPVWEGIFGSWDGAT